MITIRNSQMQAFAVDLYRRFRASIVKGVYDAAHAREEPMTQSAVEAAVDAALARAGHYGIVERDDLTQFGHLLVMLGPEFDRDPTRTWVSFLLQHSELSPPTKVALIAARAAQTRRGEEGTHTP